MNDKYNEFISSQKFNPNIGIQLERGWSPILAVVEDGERRVLKFSSWTGGEGTPPTNPIQGLEYLTQDGFGAIEDAVNIRGAGGTTSILIDLVADDHTLVTPTKVPFVVYQPIDNHMWIWDGTTWYDMGEANADSKADKVIGGVEDNIVTLDADGNIQDGGQSIQDIIDLIPTPVTYDVFTQTVDGLVPAPTTLNDYFLRDDGTWQPVSGGTGVTALSDLDDVALGKLAVNDALVYNGTKWANFPLGSISNDKRYIKLTIPSSGNTNISATMPNEYIHVVVTGGAGTIAVITLNVNNAITDAWLWLYIDKGYGNVQVKEYQSASNLIDTATINQARTLYLLHYVNGHWELDARLITSESQATPTNKGIMATATGAETQADTEYQKAVTPYSLSTRTATTSRTGIAALATPAEVTANTNNTKIVTPLALGGLANFYNFAGTDLIRHDGGHETVLGEYILYGTNKYYVCSFHCLILNTQQAANFYDIQLTGLLSNVSTSTLAAIGFCNVYANDNYLSSGRVEWINTQSTGKWIRIYRNGGDFGAGNKIKIDGTCTLYLE